MKLILNKENQCQIAKHFNALRNKTLMAAKGLNHCKMTVYTNFIFSFAYSGSFIVYPSIHVKTHNHTVTKEKKRTGALQINRQMF